MALAVLGAEQIPEQRGLCQKVYLSCSILFVKWGGDDHQWSSEINAGWHVLLVLVLDCYTAHNRYKNILTVTEWLRLEGTTWDHLVQLSCFKQSHLEHIVKKEVKNIASLVTVFCYILY